METKRIGNGKKAHADKHRPEHVLTRVPRGHIGTKEREFILRMIDSRVTRQEGGRVPLLEYTGRLRHKL